MMLQTLRVFSAVGLLAGATLTLASMPVGASEASETGWSAKVRVAQLSAADLVLRIDRLEAENRRLTGLVEQLQYRNQQLEQQLRAAQGASGPAPQAEAQSQWRAPDARGAPPPAGMPPQTATAAPLPPDLPSASAPTASTPPPIGRTGRRDVFDPTQNPNAPGAPRTLGTISETAGAPPQSGLPPAGLPAPEPADVGAPGGRAAGAPLDLSSLSAQAAREMPPVTSPTASPGVMGAPGGSYSAPLPRSASPAPTQTVMAPSATPRDEYDLAYGYVLHKDYALAEDGFRGFLKRYPGDRLVPEANFWLGEAQFQRQRYREAAESFLTVSTKYETAAKAPDALLRLGQSLAALGEKDAACATFNEVGRKYPRASVVLKQGVEREQKRAGC